MYPADVQARAGEWYEANEYGISLLSLDDAFQARWEPGAAPVQDRIAALRALADRGLRTWVSIEPYPTPNIDPGANEVERLLEAVALADRIVFGKWNYNRLAEGYARRHGSYGDVAARAVERCAERGIAVHVKSGTPVACDAGLASTVAAAGGGRWPVAPSEEIGRCVDGCRHTYLELATTVLPSYMAAGLRESMERPLEISRFAEWGVGPATLLSSVRRSVDFAGCCVLMEPSPHKPVYVGISRSVFRRLKQHVTGKTHYDATLAYLMASRGSEQKMERSAAMADPEFQRRFAVAQEYLRSLVAAFVEIYNPLELHVFEAHCALELGTAEWNIFATH